jgi:hypothetical protein
MLENIRLSRMWNELLVILPLEMLDVSHKTIELFTTAEWLLGLVR